MIALVSTLLGFISSAVPEFIRLFREGKDREHELALLNLQMNYDREKLALFAQDYSANRAERLQEITVQAHAAESVALNDRLKSNLTGIHWVDALAGTVRPCITYAFFGLYFMVKCGQFYLLIDPDFPWVHQLSVSQALVSIWTEEDTAIFSAIMAFWFGSRAISKTRNA